MRAFPRPYPRRSWRAYRFFGNSQVTAEAILAPHVRETLGRVQQDPVTRVVHDSSTLSFNSEGFREGLVQPRRKCLRLAQQVEALLSALQILPLEAPVVFVTPRSEPG